MTAIERNLNNFVLKKEDEIQHKSAWYQISEQSFKSHVTECKESAYYNQCFNKNVNFKYSSYAETVFESRTF